MLTVPLSTTLFAKVLYPVMWTFLFDTTANFAACFSLAVNAIPVASTLFALVLYPVMWTFLFDTGSLGLLLRLRVTCCRFIRPLPLLGGGLSVDGRRSGHGGGEWFRH